MQVEKTTTGVIFHNPTHEIKEKCLQYFSLKDPIREYFVYSGNDPDNQIKFIKKDVIYITSGFMKIKDVAIRKLIFTKKIEPPTPGRVVIKMDKEPRSQLQKDCIKTMTESKSPKITVELKPGVDFRHPRMVTCV